MTFHYHVTPITPEEHLLRLAGRHFMVNFYYPRQLATVQKIAAGLVTDNGAYPMYVQAMAAFEEAKAAGQDVSVDDFIRTNIDWRGDYEWTDPILDSPCAWAIIPDVIGAGGQEQDALLRQWPHGKERAAPVYHTDEPIDRLLRLLDEWPKVCIGATGEHWRIWMPGLWGVELDPVFERRMDEIWTEIDKRHKRTPYIHMLRGMGLTGRGWAIASDDSSNAAQNGHRYGGPVGLVQRLDSANNPARTRRGKKLLQIDMFERRQG